MLTRARPEPTPVTVLTGFLGSGKTTILAKLLRDPEMTDTAVIVNEFGEVGLDHYLVSEGKEDVVLLDSGCLCCTISNTLGDTLAALVSRRARGDVPAFDHVIIETTGLADPAPILHTLMTDDMVHRNFMLDGVITTVDGMFGCRQLEIHAETRKQVALADRIVITKTDVASEQNLVEVRRRLTAINNRADIVEVAWGQLAAHQVRGFGLRSTDGRVGDIARWLGVSATDSAAEGDAHDDHAHEYGDSHDVNRHSADIHTFCVYLDEPITWEGYAAWLEAVRRFDGERLMRVKGIVRMDRSEKPYVIQGVQHVFARPERLEWWLDEDLRSRIVFIVNGLERASLEAGVRLLTGPSTVEGGPSRNR